MRDIELVYNSETRKWEERKEPFATMEFPTEEDYLRFKEMVAFWNEHHPNPEHNSGLCHCGRFEKVVE